MLEANIAARLHSNDLQWRHRASGSMRHVEAEIVAVVAVAVESNAVVDHRVANDASDHLHAVACCDRAHAVRATDHAVDAAAIDLC